MNTQKKIDKLNDNVEILIDKYLYELQEINRSYCCGRSKEMKQECGECGRCRSLYYSDLRDKMINKFTIK
jgi:hypothetical protein